MFRHIINWYVASNIYQSGVNKVRANGELGEDFEKKFNVNSREMLIAGYLESVGAVLMSLSLVSKTFGRLGALMASIVMSAATVKHYLAGDSFDESKSSLKLASLSILSFLASLRK